MVLCGRVRLRTDKCEERMDRAGSSAGEMAMVDTERSGELFGMP